MAGRWQTHIVVWDTGDTSKLGDPRFWWSAAEVGRLQRVSSSAPVAVPVMAGMPKGRSLSAWRKEFGGEEGVIFESGPVDAHHFAPGRSEQEVALLLRPHAPPYVTHRLSLRHWRDSDPETTRLIMHHIHQPTAEEQEEMSRLSRPIRPEVEQLHKERFAAHKSGDAELQAQLDEELEALGYFKSSSVSAWNSAKAVEIEPGVLVQDERPKRR